MKIGIGGAGLAGSWLARRCAKRGLHVDLFDQGKKERCGLTSCAWGFQLIDSARLLSLVDLDIRDFILSRPDRVVSKRWGGRINNIAILDKASLINNLVEKIHINHKCPEPNDFDYFVDATGLARAFLPPITHDRISSTVQTRCKTDLEVPDVYVTSGGDPQSYAWAFPLGEGEWHIGYGDMMPLGAVVRCNKGDQLSLNTFGTRHDVTCSCEGNIRVTGPSASRPFVNENVWGIGESIGCVSPITGEGNAPAMRSAEIFLNHVLINGATPEQYERIICREFSWMDRERRFFDALSEGKRVKCFWHGIFIICRLSIERLRSNPSFTV